MILANKHDRAVSILVHKRKVKLSCQYLRAFKNQKLSVRRGGDRREGKGKEQRRVEENQYLIQPVKGHQRKPLAPPEPAGEDLSRIKIRLVNEVTFPSAEERKGLSLSQATHGWRICGLRA